MNLALITCGAVLAFAPSAAAFELGIEDDTVLVDGYTGDPATSLAQGRALGASVVRVMVDPSRVERFGWTDVDTTVNLARAHGYRVWMTFSWSPWGTDGFTRFASAAALHLRGRVADFTLINEPDFMGMKPALYRKFFVLGRSAIRRANPTARVYVGDLSGVRPVAYMRAVLKSGPVRAEGFAWHPYQFLRAPELDGGRRDAMGIGRVPRVRAYLRSVVHVLSTPRHKPLGMYLTEFGYLTRGRNAISDGQAAAWWPRAIKQTKRSGVRLLVAYQMTSASPERLWDSSLIGPDGKPRLAFQAIRGLGR